jgi:hypothetical protein
VGALVTPEADSAFADAAVDVAEASRALYNLISFFAT